METKLPEEHEHQLVVSETTDECKCGGTHEKGDVIWGGSHHPDEYKPAREVRKDIVERIHGDVTVEYRNV